MFLHCEMYYLYKNFNQLDNKAYNEVMGGVKIEKSHPHIDIEGMSKMVLSWKRYFLYFSTTFIYSGINRCFSEYSVKKGNRIISRALLITKTPNYKFLPKDGVHICYCETIPQEQGKGYYSLLLKAILANNPGKHFYMIVEEKNTPSIKGIERAGFVRCGEVEKTERGSFVTKKLY